MKHESAMVLLTVRPPMQLAFIVGSDSGTAIGSLLAASIVTQASLQMTWMTTDNDV